MGPGLFSPENVAYEIYQANVNMLQWGRAYSARRIADEDDGTTAIELASMGPGLFSPENKTKLPELMWGRCASMGPGLFSPENTWTTAVRPY